MKHDGMILCEHCMEGIESREGKFIILDTIYQEIDYDDKKGKWYQLYDEDEGILKCEWCEEPDSTLYVCERR